MTIKQTAKQLRDIAKALVQIAESLGARDTQEPYFPDDRMQDIEDGVCLYCGERIDGTEKANRGLHHRCYKKVMNGIRAGKYTEAEAVAAGKLYPKLPGGRRPATQTETVIQEIRAAASQSARTKASKTKP